MARKKVEAQEAQEKKVLTRAQKTGATKVIVTELLAVKPMRHNELIDEVAKAYVQRYEGTDTENPNDVKGRVGSVLDIMKKDSDIAYDGGMYALKARMPLPVAEQSTEKTEEKPAPKKRTRAKKAVIEETPAPAESNPTATAAEGTKTPVAEEKPAEKAEEKPAPKKRGRPKKAAGEKPAEKVAEKAEEIKVETPAKEQAEKKEPAPAPMGTPIPAPAVEKKAETSLTVTKKAEVAQKSVMDMSFLFGAKPTKTEKSVEKVEKKEEKPIEKLEKKVEKTPIAKKEQPKAAPQAKTAPQAKVEAKQEGKPQQRAPMRAAKLAKPLTEDEKLRDSFLKRMRLLSGEYFEYYSVYLLQRYSMKNGRRLESMRVSGGDHDGGIDGEIELTDKLGFRETIYIQSKNWDPEKGREDNWVVGETLLQQFIGACACRQAKDGKQHTRGIFITTSRFTPDAKRILDDMSEKIVGYDGEDLYEAAKECQFGVVKKNGKWELDENLLSGTKAFFQMY